MSKIEMFGTLCKNVLGRRNSSPTEWVYIVEGHEHSSDVAFQARDARNRRERKISRQKVKNGEEKNVQELAS